MAMNREELRKEIERVEQLKRDYINVLLEQRKGIDEELAQLGYHREGKATGSTVFTGMARGTRKCANCGLPGHNSKTCPEPKKEATEEVAPKLRKKASGDSKP